MKRELPWRTRSRKPDAAGASGAREQLQWLAAAMLRNLSRMGWAGAVGLGLLVFAVVCEWTGSQAARERVAELESARLALRRQIQQPLTQTVSPQAQLQAFYQRFPLLAALPDVLMSLDRSARKQGLSPLRASYRESVESGTPLRRVRITIPVRGRYADVRAWLSEVLAEMPELGVEALELRRKDITSDEIEAQARFVVFLRGKP